MEASSAFRLLTAGTRFRKPKTTAQSTPSPIATTSNVKVEDLDRRTKNSDASVGSDINNASSSQGPTSDERRRKHRIRCTGTDIPPVWSSFEDFTGLSEDVIGNLAGQDIKEPSPIQMQAPSIMASRRDLLACAPTGSGKTLAFLLPLFLLSQDIAVKCTTKQPLSVVIEPTRELARQVYTEANRLKAGTSWSIQLLGEADAGDEDFDLNAETLEGSLLISTPLKLVYAIKAKQVDLSQVQQLVLDEADRLFELGLLEQTDEIIAACTHKDLRKAMFSATIPSGVEELARSVLGSDMIRVIIGGSDMASSKISQQLTYAGNEDGKIVALKELIRTGQLVPPCLIFVQSIDRAKDLNRELLASGVKSDVMHSERTKPERDHLVQAFADSQIWVLVCTDVMSRGVDFRGVELVINYDFPQTVQSYIHRIGRTGRAGRSGCAITLFTRDDVTFLRSIVNVMRNSGCEVHPWMLNLPAPSQNEKKRMRKRPVERKDVSKTAGSAAGTAGARRKRKKLKSGSGKAESKPAAQAQSAESNESAESAED